MTAEAEEFLRNTPNIRRALKQIFLPEVADYVVTLIVQDNLTKKSKKYYENLKTKGDETNEQIGS